MKDQENEKHKTINRLKAQTTEKSAFLFFLHYNKSIVVLLSKTLNKIYQSTKSE